MFESRQGGSNVEHGPALHRAGVVEGHAMGDASPAVMTGDLKLIKAQYLHYRDVVTRHAALAVGGMITAGVGFATVPVAAQISENHREVFGQLRRHFVPAYVCLRIPVKQKQRRSAAGHSRVNGDLSCINLAM